MRKSSAILLGLSTVGVGGSAAVTVERARFRRRLRTMARELEVPLVRSAEPGGVPADVLQLAERIGISALDAPPVVIRLRQSGTLQRSPASGEARFRAAQIMAVAQPGFVWHARCAPLQFLEIGDFLTPRAAGLEARLFGALPVASFTDSDAAARGEMSRYLAELALVPDALLHNHSLQWRSLDDGALEVSAGEGPRRAAVRLRLNEEGLIATAEMEDRPRWDQGAAVEQPWRGRFSDYRRIEGRMLPTLAEASWLNDGAECVSWRGHLLHWSPR